MWKAEQDDEYFRIFDSKKNIAGYIEPDYGIAYDDEDAQEKVERMIKSGESVLRGFVTIPMIKFGIFDTDYNANIITLESQIELVSERTRRWREFTETWPGCKENIIRISHTDHDMLSITFPVVFSNSVQLKADKLLDAVRPMLDKLQEMGLL